MVGTQEVIMMAVVVVVGCRWEMKNKSEIGEKAVGRGGEWWC